MPQATFLVCHKQIWPQGTWIITSQPLFLPGHGNKSVFAVDDMGDVNCSKGLSRYWFDIYFGETNNKNDSNAIQFGKKSGINYTADTID
jgi:hypothetical protein